MKYILLLITASLFTQRIAAQKKIVDESMRYQQERMVFKQWDQNKFTPTSGFLGLNPYYWLTWGLMPGYKKQDLRPLSAGGPQSQRLGLVGVMNSTDNEYKLHADTLRNAALLEIANHSGALSSTDPLWIMYYSKELKPVLEHTMSSILSGLSSPLQKKVISEGLYSWYKNELDILKERIDAARNTDMDRGSRILAYHRMLLEYRVLEASWATRIVSGDKNMQRSADQDKAKAGQVNISGWTPDADVRIANQVVTNRKY